MGARVSTKAHQYSPIPDPPQAGGQGPCCSTAAQHLRHQAGQRLKGRHCRIAGAMDGVKQLLQRGLQLHPTWGMGDRAELSAMVSRCHVALPATSVPSSPSTQRHSCGGSPALAPRPCLTCRWCPGSRPAQTRATAPRPCAPPVPRVPPRAGCAAHRWSAPPAAPDLHGAARPATAPPPPRCPRQSGPTGTPGMHAGWSARLQAGQ